MTGIPFDADEFYTALVESGVSEAKANALTKSIVRLENAKLEDLTTKRDLAETKVDLTRIILIVGICVGSAQLVIIFMLLMKMTGKT